MTLPIIAATIATENDVVAARQRARQVADALGFERQDQVRIATAVSEVARNALGYAGGGRVEFAVDADPARQAMVVIVSDKGPGIADLDHVLSGQYRSATGMGLGLVGARRLMDDVRIDTAPGSGTRVLLRKERPRRGVVLTPAALGGIADRLVRERPRDAFAELREQNRELLEAGEALRRQQDELRAVNGELEETNRGVLALYAELEDRAGELKLANEVRSRFHSNVSHELRTPIQSIRAIAQLVLDRTDGALTGEQERQLRYIQEAAATLAGMVDDLLDVAKAEAGRLDLAPAAFGVADLFGGLRGLLRPLRASDAVDLVFADDAGLPSMFTDEAKLTQVLRNLVSNALKFTERGEVRVSARWDESRDVMEFRVADTGVGIASADQERVFEEFAQVPNPLQARAKGTGLGLSLSRRLIELMDGDIRVDSALGAGATFIVTIPRDARSGRAVPPDGAPVAGPAGRVLVIDDDAAWRYRVRQALSGTIEMVEADGGRAGLDELRRSRPDLVILDLAMPDVDGYAVAAALAGDPGSAGIPVIVVTASSPDGVDRSRLPGTEVILGKAQLSAEAIRTVVVSRLSVVSRLPVEGEAAR